MLLNLTINSQKLRNLILLFVTFLIVLGHFNPTNAQWTNRYQKLDGVGHHVYIESYELPILTYGPQNPTASPDGKSLAYASEGWIWILNLETGVSKPLTNEAGVDSRPNWSSDGQKLTFVRDNGSDTSIIVKTISNGKEVVINTPSMELDPTFSKSGTYIYYSSAQTGRFDIWKRNLETGEDEQITGLGGMERNPRLLSDGNTLIYIHTENSSHKSIRMRSLLEGTDVEIKRASLAGQSSLSTHPTARSIVYAWPNIESWSIFEANLDDPVPTRELVVGDNLPQMPTWSADGNLVYYSIVEKNQNYKLMQVSTHGGSAQPVVIKEENDLGVLNVQTHLGGNDNPQAVRLSIKNSKGHPIPNPNGATYFDSENGLYYFYSDGDDSFSLPKGDYEITAVYGLYTSPQTKSIKVRTSRTASVSLELDEIWNPSQEGFVAADHHFHLNYDGPYPLLPKDIEPLMAGENINVATPLAANLHNRVQDLGLEGFEKRTSNGGILKFGQEVRSHLHGHIGLVGTTTNYYPWFWGPPYPEYGNTDLSNSSVLKYAEKNGGIGTYVHPIISTGNPFTEENIGGIPMEVIADGVLGDLGGLEIACVWSDEIGTAELWYRFLNIGRDVKPMAGADMFTDFQRTPALGAARLYVDIGDAPLEWGGYFQHLKDGKSFVTNGPAVLFEMEGVGPGGVVSKGGIQNWNLDLKSATSVLHVEIIVNGEVVFKADGLEKAGSKLYSGSLSLPRGGWVAARVWGGGEGWPSMDSYSFAHTAPIWIGAKGSVDSVSYEAARLELLKALDASEVKANAAYGDKDISLYRSRIKEARDYLGHKK